VLSRLTRIVGNPWLRVGLLAVVLASCGYGLYLEWPDVAAGLGRLHAYSVILSVAAAMAGGACMMLAWRAVLADLGSPLPVRTAARISFVSQLGKYVPGAVWAFAAQVELGHDAGVPRRRSVAAFAISLAITIGAGLGVAAAAMPIASPALLQRYWWALAAVPVLAIGLCPPVFGFAMNRLLKLSARQPLERRPSWPELARALAWTLLGWGLLGLQVWLLLADVAPGWQRLLPLAVGGYALAFSVSTLLVVFPSGIGAREVVLTAALSSVLSPGEAVAVALVTRAVTTIADLAWGGLGLALGRLSGGRGPVHQTVAAPAAGSPAPTLIESALPAPALSAPDAAARP
jgi:uncharacterized membrane protein YbhN (UPF0104 family)